MAGFYWSIPKRLLRGKVLEGRGGCWGVTVIIISLMMESGTGEGQREVQVMQNASLAMQMLEEEFGHNEEQINFMENFIERKYGEISDLQGFLVAELQSIENSKAKNRRIEKILVASTLPALAQTKQLLNIVKTVVQPLCLTAANFVEAVGEKAKALLLEKQAINAKQQEEIVGLKRTIEELKKECQEAKKYEGIKDYQEREKPKEEVRGERRSPNKPYMADQRFSKLSKLIDADNRSSKASIQMSTYKGKEEREDSVSAVSAVSKTGNKMSKYEQCYNNILESKKIIQYRCERMPMNPINQNHLSPTKSIKKIGEEVKRSIKEERPIKEERLAKEETISKLGERKEYIKQKIEKIKIKAECRQFKNQSPFNEKMRW